MTYIKLAEAPVWVIQYPQCSACMVDLFTDGDGWTCPVCGTQWDMNANDGDKGELYESWSGETLEDDPVSESDAMKAGIEYEQAQRRAALKHSHCKAVGCYNRIQFSDTCSRCGGPTSPCDQ